MSRRKVIPSTTPRRHRASSRFLEDETIGLDEIEAPAPIENLSETSEYGHTDLESNVRRTQSQRSRPSGRLSRGYSNLSSGYEPGEFGGIERRYSHLNEIAGPPPDQNPRQLPQYRHSSLEHVRTSIQQSLSQQTPEPTTKLSVRVLEQVYIISYLILFAILGTLARVGLQVLTVYPNAPITISEVWANFGGCLVMGYISEDRILFLTATVGKNVLSTLREQVGASDSENADEERYRKNEEQIKEHQKSKKGVPLYIGLSVGFAGCFTSFSSFMRDVFLAISNDLPTKLPRNGADSLMAALAVLILELCLSFSGLTIGGMLAIAAEPILLRIPIISARRFLDPAATIVGWGAWLGAVSWRFGLRIDRPVLNQRATGTTKLGEDKLSSLWCSLRSDACYASSFLYS
ncbi:MAG: hypothetical protein M1820_006403 [Bogoriella megaspora]|nr:MAG: hypothetical protein M1820_006403 [Bogoriella megaspora]